MLVSTTRVLKYAIQNFLRNFWLSFVTLTILFLALASINAMIIVNLLAKVAINTVEDRIDVNVTFKSTASESQVLDVQNQLLAVGGVKEVKYISREDALINFKANHKNDPEVLAGLDLLKDNPLGAALIVKAESPQQYDKVIELLNGKKLADLVESRDFEDYRLLISRIAKITDRLSSATMIMAAIFGLISIMIVFNTLRVAVYTHREEIRIMRLVGATKGFIIAPYILEGIIFAVGGLAIMILAIYPLLGILQPYISTFFEGQDLDLVSYFNQNFLFIFGAQLLATIAINTVSAIFAVRKYI